MPLHDDSFLHSDSGSQISLLAPMKLQVSELQQAPCEGLMVKSFIALDWPIENLKRDADSFLGER